MASSTSSSASGSSPHEAGASGNSSAIQCFKYSKRATLRSVVGRPDGGQGLAGQRAVVGGWVKSSRVLKARRAGKVPPAKMLTPEPETANLTCTEVLMTRVPLMRRIAKMITGDAGANDRPSSGSALVRINDGSCVPDLQVVVDSSLCPLDQVTAAGACVLVEGEIELVEGRGQQHIVQLRVDKVLHVGAADSSKYPLSKLQLPSELVRDHPQFAARTTAVAATARVRSELIHATHAFFQTNGFFHVNTPIITTITAAGDHSKLFRVMCLLSKPEDGRGITPDAVRASIEAKGKQIEALKRSESNKEALEAAELDLQRANDLARQLEKGGANADFAGNFFQRPAYLSANHTLHLETYACALSSVYTLSPAFQAAEYLEPHKDLLAERWTIDVELAFAEIEDALSCAEDCLRWLCNAASKNCSDELKFLSIRAKDKGYEDRIELVLSGQWQKITYKEAIETLLQVTDKSFDTKVELGTPLSPEHMSYLVDDCHKKPLIIHEYPKNLKPFYARLMEDMKTVSAFDIVVPKVGVVASGAQKEERLEMLTSRIDELGLPHEPLEWYLDIRRHGTVKHSGFSIDMERLVLLVTGLKEIRDVNPFARTKGNAKC